MKYLVLVNFPKLSKNPIAEALIQYRFQCAEPVNLDALNALSKLYTTKKVDTIKSVTIGLTGKGPVQKETTIGYRLELSNGHDMIQLQQDSFTLSRVGSYDSWEGFRDSFFTAWKIAERELSPTNIQRVGTRFINKIHLPTDLENADMFMNLSPHLSSPTLDTTADEFFLRVSMPIKEIDGRAIVSHVLDKNGSTKNGLQLILDIDIFVLKDMKPATASQLETLDKIRIIKNKIFYNSFTAEGLGLYI